MKNWHAVYTQANRDFLAQQHLLKQGFEVYLPRIRKQTRHARKTQESSSPLFPRYLFVRVDTEAQRWRSINGTIGVVGIISDGATPIKIPDAVIEEIVVLEGENGLIEPPSVFTKGEGVRVISGPMQNLEGIFECVDAHSRVTLLLRLMGDWVRVHVDNLSITAA